MVYLFIKRKFLRKPFLKPNRKDYIQLLLDAQASSNENDKYEDDSIDLTSINLNKKLSPHVKFDIILIAYESI
jgi:hypothetical protein